MILEIVHLANTFREKLAILIGGEKFAFLVQTAEKHNQTVELVNQYLQKLSKLISRHLTKIYLNSHWILLLQLNAKIFKLFIKTPGLMMSLFD